MKSYLVLAIMALLSFGCTTEVLSPAGNPIIPPKTSPMPPKVDPIIIDGRQYGGGFNQGALPITDVKTGERIKNVTIYKYPPEAFFRSMKLVNKGRDILIENEVGDKYLFNIKTEKVSTVGKRAK
jgi:hypothetical protein